MRLRLGPGLGFGRVGGGLPGGGGLPDGDYLVFDTGDFLTFGTDNFLNF